MDSIRGASAYKWKALLFISSHCSGTRDKWSGAARAVRAAHIPGQLSRIYHHLICMAIRVWGGSCFEWFFRRKTCDVLVRDFQEAHSHCQQYTDMWGRATLSAMCHHIYCPIMYCRWWSGLGAAAAANSNQMAIWMGKRPIIYYHFWPGIHGNCQREAQLA